MRNQQINNKRGIVLTRKSYRKRLKKYKINTTTGNNTALQKEGGINLFDSGLLIGLVTVLGYFIAYAYQKGYWLYYGVTQEFLNQISIVNILVSMSVIGFGIGSFIMYYQSVKGSLPRSNNPVRQMLPRVVLPILFICMGILVLIPSNLFKVQPMHLSYVLLIILVISYMYPLLSQWHIKGYKNKLIKHLEEQEYEGVTVENIILKYKIFPSFKFFYLFIVFVTCFFVSFFWGYKSAIDKENYLVFDAHGEKFVVIDRNGENFLVSRIDLEKKEINKSFQVIEIKSDIDKPIFFNNIKIEGGIKVSDFPEF